MDRGSELCLGVTGNESVIVDLGVSRDGNLRAGIGAIEGNWFVERQCLGQQIVERLCFLVFLENGQCSFQRGESGAETHIRQLIQDGWRLNLNIVEVELENRHGRAGNETRSDGAEVGSRWITWEIQFGVPRILKLGRRRWQKRSPLPEGRGR